jgi:hypothetical protein
MSLGRSFHIILSLAFILLLKNEPGNLNALIVENNPFYGLDNEKVNSIESTTDDNLINIKLEYAPKAFQTGTPEFFSDTLL